MPNGSEKIYDIVIDSAKNKNKPERQFTFGEQEPNND